MGGSEFVTSLSRLCGAPSRPRLRKSGVAKRREEAVTFPGWRDERTERFLVDCPLPARRETAPPLLHVTVRAL